MRRVLVSTTLVITPGTVNEQNGEIDWVEKGQRAGEEGGHTPEERRQNLRDVVEMARQTPPAGGQQQGGAFLTIGSEVLGNDVIRLASPDFRLTVRGTEDLTLTTKQER